MAHKTLPELKARFETGDTPTGQDFEDLIDTLGSATVTGANTVVKFDKDYIQQPITQTGPINLTGDFTDAKIGAVVRLEIAGNGVDPISHSFTTGSAIGNFDNTITNVVYLHYVSNNTVDIVIDGGLNTNPNQPTNPASLASMDLGWDMADAVTSGSNITSVPNKKSGEPALAAGGTPPVLGTTNNSLPIAEFAAGRSFLGVTRTTGSNYETWIAIVDVNLNGTIQPFIAQSAAGGGKFRINAANNAFSFAADTNGSPTYADVQASITAGLHMITVVSDQNGKHNLYIDDVLVNQSNETLVDFGSAQNTVWSAFWGNGCISHLAEFYHYNTDLDAQTITSIWDYVSNKYSL